MSVADNTYKAAVFGFEIDLRITIYKQDFITGKA